MYTGFGFLRLYRSRVARISPQQHLVGVLSFYFLPLSNKKSSSVRSSSIFLYTIGWLDFSLSKYSLCCDSWRWSCQCFRLWGCPQSVRHPQGQVIATTLCIYDIMMLIMCTFKNIKKREHLLSWCRDRAEARQQRRPKSGLAAKFSFLFFFTPFSFKFFFLV